MRHAKTRHATDTEEADAIGEPGTIRGEIVPRGVAQNPAPIIPAQVNPHAPAYNGAPLATRPVYPSVAYNPYPGLPAHIADQLTPGIAERTGWGAFQRAQDLHLWPALGVLSGVACGWGAAATEPMHPWFGSVATGIGIVGALGYGAVHLVRSINGSDEQEPVPVGVHIIGLGGAALTAFGVACITGISFLSAGVTLIPLAAGYYAWFQNRHSRIQDQRQFVVDYTAASTPALVPMPGAPAAAPAAIPGTVLSYEEQQIRRAFEGDGTVAGMGIKLADIHSFQRIDADSWAVTVVLAPAANVSPESVIARKDVLRSALGARQVIALTTPRGHELRLTVRYGEIDPLAETIVYPGPATYSITEGIPIGVSADGSLSALTLLGVHTIVGGATGGGKSVIVKVLLTSLAAVRDAVLWLIDLKPGQIELGIFEPIADRSARSLADAALMFEALTAVAKARGDYLAQLRRETGQPVEKWDPKVHGPVIVVLVDELAELTRQGKKVRKGQYPDRIMEAIKWVVTNFETAAQVYRALGIQLVIATQSPSSAITSGDGKDAIDQFQNLVCVQTAKVSQTNIILGQGAHGDGFRANTELYVSGMFYMKTPGSSVPVKHKAYWIDNEQIVSCINQYAAERPVLDELSAEAAASVLGTVGATPRTGPGGPGGGVPVLVQDAPPVSARGNLRSVPTYTYPNGAPIDEKHRALWALLGSPQFRKDGATVGELQAAAMRAGHAYTSLAWVRDRCKEWRESGNVVFVKEGQDYRYWRDDESIALGLRKEA